MVEKDYRRIREQEKREGRLNLASKAFFIGGLVGTYQLFSDTIKRANPVLKFVKDNIAPAMYNFVMPAVLIDAGLTFVSMGYNYAVSKKEVLSNLRIAQLLKERSVDEVVEQISQNNLSLPKAEAECAKILYHRCYDAPNEFQQKLMNRVHFRAFTIPEGKPKLPTKTDYSLSAVYSAMREWETLKFEQGINYTETEGLNGDELIAAQQNNSLVESLKPQILKDLDESGLTEKYMPLTQTMMWKENKLISFPQIFADAFDSGKPNSPGSVEQLIFEIVNANSKKHYTEYEGWKTTMLDDANRIISDIGELGLDEEQIKGIRKRARYHNYFSGLTLDENAAENEKAKKEINGKALSTKISLTKEQFVRLKVVASHEYAKQVDRKLIGNYITADWCIGALQDKNTAPIWQFWHWGKKRAIARKKELVRQILNIGQNSEDKVKKGNVNKLFTNGEFTKFAQLQSNLELINSGLNSTDYFNEQNGDYIVYNNKLHKNSNRIKKKLILQNCPEMKRASFRRNIFPVIGKLFGKAFFTLATVAISAVVILSGAGTVATAIAAGAAAGALVNKGFLERKFGPFPYFTKKARAYRKMIREDKEGRRYAPKTCVTTKRFELKAAKTPISKLMCAAFGASASRQGELFSWHNSLVRNKTKTDKHDFNLDSFTSENFGAVFGVDPKTPLGRKLTEANQQLIREAINHNADVQFLENPIEIYVTNHNGNQPQKFLFATRELAMRSMPYILLANTAKSEGSTVGSTIKIVCGDAKSVTIYPNETRIAATEFVKIQSIVGETTNQNPVDLIMKTVGKIAGVEVESSTIRAVLEDVYNIGEEEKFMRRDKKLLRLIRAQQYCELDSNGNPLIEDGFLVPKSGEGARILTEANRCASLISKSKVESPLFPIDFKNVIKEDQPEDEESDDEVDPPETDEEKKEREKKEKEERERKDRESAQRAQRLKEKQETAEMIAILGKTLNRLEKKHRKGTAKALMVSELVSKFCRLFNISKIDVRRTPQVPIVSDIYTKEAVEVARQLSSDENIEFLEKNKIKVKTGKKISTGRTVPKKCFGQVIDVQETVPEEIEITPERIKTIREKIEKGYIERAAGEVNPLIDEINSSVKDIKEKVGKKSKSLFEIEIPRHEPVIITSVEDYFNSVETHAASVLSKITAAAAQTAVQKSGLSDTYQAVQTKIEQLQKNARKLKI